MTRVRASANRRPPYWQAALIASLTERCAGQGIRFDTGFDGTNPMCARGRIGRRFFAFWYKGDNASLTIGSPNHRNMASRAKLARRKALRALRRSEDPGSRSLFFQRRDLKQDTLLDRRPSRVIWHAARDNITGQCGGTLELSAAAELFLELLGEVQRPAPAPKRSEFDAAIMRGSYTPPSGWKQGIIHKPSKNRR